MFKRSTLSIRNTPKRVPIIQRVALEPEIAALFWKYFYEGLSLGNFLSQATKLLPGYTEPEIHNSIASKRNTILPFVDMFGVKNGQSRSLDVASTIRKCHALARQNGGFTFVAYGLNTAPYLAQNAIAYQVYLAGGLPEVKDQRVPTGRVRGKGRYGRKAVPGSPGAGDAADQKQQQDQGVAPGLVEELVNRELQKREAELRAREEALRQQQQQQQQQQQLLLQQQQQLQSQLFPPSQYGGSGGGTSGIGYSSSTSQEGKDYGSPTSCSGQKGSNFSSSGGSGASGANAQPNQVPGITFSAAGSPSGTVSPLVRSPRAAQTSSLANTVSRFLSGGNSDLKITSSGTGFDVQDNANLNKQLTLKTTAGTISVPQVALNSALIDYESGNRSGSVYYNAQGEPIQDSSGMSFRLARMSDGNYLVSNKPTG